jgi:hypothetical protein
VPDGIGRGARSSCGRCGEILVYREPPAGLAGAHLDPFVRRYGMRSRVLWGWLVGCTFWLPLLLAAWVVLGRVDFWAFLLLSVPCVATVYWLLLRRRGTPAVVWSGYFGLGMGGYAVYCWALLETWLAPGGGHLVGLCGFGALSVLAGSGCLARHAILVRRLPRLDRVVAPEWAPSDTAALDITPSCEPEPGLLRDPRPMGPDHGEGS